MANRKPGFEPWSLYDFLWTNWHRDRFFSKKIRHFSAVSFHQHAYKKDKWVKPGKLQTQKYSFSSIMAQRPIIIWTLFFILFLRSFYTVFILFFTMFFILFFIFFHSVFLIALYFNFLIFSHFFPYSFCTLFSCFKVLTSKKIPGIRLES